MSLAKQEVELREERRTIALTIAERVGILTRCKMHDDVYILTTEDLTEAYMLGNALVSKGDDLVSGFKGARRLLTDTIKNAVEDEGAEECWRCVKFLED